MSRPNNKTSDKKKIPALFREAVINNDLKKYHNSPVVLKKADEAKKFLANFNFS